MNVKNCRKCKRLFNYLSGPQLCPACRDELEKKFQEVKEYIRNNKGAHVQQVSEECDVDENQIRQWVREERLVFSDAAGTGMVCETCGTPIATGRYCDKCKNGLINGLTEAGKRPEAPKPERVRESGSKMRFINNN